VIVGLAHINFLWKFCYFPFEMNKTDFFIESIILHTHVPNENSIRQTFSLNFFTGCPDSTSRSGRGSGVRNLCQYVTGGGSVSVALRFLCSAATIYFDGLALMRLSCEFTRELALNIKSNFFHLFIIIL